jgi:hypothetical protein
VRRALPLRYVLAAKGHPVNEEDKALCPFHDDGDPSLGLYRAEVGDHDRWHCFPCGEGGDVFDVLMRMEGLSFPAAIARAKDMLRDFGRLPAEFWERHRLPAKPKELLDPVMWEAHLKLARAYGLDHPAELAATARFDQSWAPVLSSWGWGLTDDGFALVPHRSEDGALTGVKIRNADRKLSAPGSSYPNLYGVWRLPRIGGPVLLAEGETDAVHAQAHLDVEDVGVRVFGLPGAGFRPTERALAPLADCDLWLALHNDEAGDRALERWTAPEVRATVRSLRVCQLSPGLDLRDGGYDVAALIGEARPV